MGSVFSPKTPPAPPPPPPVEYINWKDEVSRTQGNYVTGPDGVRTLVTSRLPLTPEEQAYEAKLDDIKNKSLGWIDKLSTNYNRSDIPWLDKYLTDWEETQRAASTDSNTIRTEQEERALGRYGQADSTAGIKARSQRRTDYRESQDAISRDLSSIEQGVRQNELTNAQNLYGIATGRQDMQLSQLADSLGRGSQMQMADANLQQNRNLAMYSGALQQQQMKQQASQAGMSNIAGLATLATLAAGPMGFGLYGASAAGAGLPAGARMVASDRRLKTDIKKVGKTDSGLNIYRYRYKGTPLPTLGVMAQEVEVWNPSAVHTLPNGIKLVDLAKVA
ncbi:tail fiber domain-containing protein [Bradyrhizobium sp.]|uniref:tail fiber domain-containing protein n=1 Tax=Bradyrhizobium sp. TaxID=376 RepID=UPI0027329A07|nr:tail fiber domain-containing protein [Bradyrhizobium sp.]MDP3078688.1 tail fiber domain-containing protein [Bradyrhizobium sp.]